MTGLQLLQPIYIACHRYVCVIIITVASFSVLHDDVLPACHHAIFLQSYTELHSQLNAAGSGKRVVNPAICLSCGSIGPAQSSFYISHVKMCGLGCGIFFLQKECNSLLINGNHVMFYTSPYVVSVQQLLLTFTCCPFACHHRPHHFGHSLNSTCSSFPSGYSR